MSAMDNVDRRIIRYVNNQWRVCSWTMGEHLGIDQVDLNARLKVLEAKGQVWLRHYCGGTNVTIVTDKEKRRRSK